MSTKKQSRGVCTYCGQELAKGGVSKHLQACTKRREVIAQAESKGGATEKLYHLRVQSADSTLFWLDLEMRGSATLKKLDDYLRAIWLECCGHLSEFFADGPWSAKVAMSRKVQDAFARNAELSHVYDFGSSSTTTIKLVSQREGVPTTKHPIVLMVRNLQPEAHCIVCGKPATVLCMECLYEDDTEGFLCDEHAEDHPHEDYGEPVPLCNSPRVGVCGYTGPAEPPY